MKKYDEYKDSGVAWIGEVPKHWEVKQLKWLFYNLDNLREPISADKRERTNPQYEYYGASGVIDKIDYYNVDDRVLLIGEDGANLVFRNLPLIYKAEGKFWVNNHAHILKPMKNVDYGYMYYTLEAADYSTFITGSAQPKLSQSNLELQTLPVPPYYEQVFIAAYLDTHCAKIDNLISIQQKRIALLQELKQSVITHAVTKGLNPNVEMKQSGVEWIGDVPKHWELVRTRYLCNLCTGSKDTINRVDDGKYPFYVRSPKVERIDTYSFDGEAILMAGDGVGAGKVFHYAVGKFDYHQRVYNFHNFKHVLGKFFYNYISNNFKYIIEEGGAKNTVDSVRLYMIQNFMTTVPPLEEQMEICNYIEQKEKVFDTSISNAQHQIELLQEYKQSLITEVVTGKRKVTDN